MSVDRELLRAVMARIVPADGDAGALEAGTDGFVVGRLERDPADAGLVAAGLAALVAIEPDFLALPAERQDAVLVKFESELWFQRLVSLTGDGFYADPDNGGNRGAVSWTMIGYRHGLPEGPSGPPAPGGDRER